MKKAAM